MKQQLKPATNPAFDTTDWQSLMQQMMDDAKKQGATATEIGASLATGFSVNVRLGEVETVEYNRDKGINITVYFGQQKGSSSSSDTSAEAIHAAVTAACDIAKVTGADDCAGLADKALLATDYPDLDLYYPWHIVPEQGIEIALECETHGRNFDARITNSDGASLSTHQANYIYANSNGFYGHYATSRHSLSCMLIGQAKQQMQRDYSYTVARAPEELKSAAFVAKQAAERTLRKLDAKRLSTRQAPVIFEADIAGGLLGGFINAIRGGNLYRKSSFLLESLGKQIFPSFIEIYEQPHLLKGLGSTPFDYDGVRTSKKHFIKNGILENYVLSTYSAKKLGMQTTGNAGGVFNLSVNTSDINLAQLFKQMGNGLFVTELMGHGVNLVTGDYSRGASGFWIENGEIQHAVEEITIAGNLRDMFMNLVTIANDIETRGNIRTGSILIEKMMIGGE